MEGPRVVSVHNPLVSLGKLNDLLVPIGIRRLNPAWSPEVPIKVDYGEAQDLTHWASECGLPGPSWAEQ